MQEDEPALSSIDELEPGSVKGWGTYVAGVAWAMRAAGARIGGADILLSGNVPPGAGLASSAALECAATLALNDLLQRGDGARGARAAGAPRRERLRRGALRGHGPDGRLAGPGRPRAVPRHPLPGIRAGAARPGRGRSGAAGHRHRVRPALVEGQYADRRAACESATYELGLAALRDLRSEELEETLATLAGERAGRVRHVVTENGQVLETVHPCARGASPKSVRC